MITEINHIPEKQNADRFRNYLAASSRLYGQAKRLAGLQFVLTVPVPITLSVLAILFPEQKVWAALYGILISIFDVALFDKLQKDWKKDAAKVQEAFDCELLEMEWRDFKVGDKPTPESVLIAARKFLRKPERIQNLRDWYAPVVGQLPLPLARIVCQRANIMWDSNCGAVTWHG